MIPTLAPDRARRSGGFSLVEMMVSITIGFLLLVGLTTIFVNSSQSHAELRKTAEQIENGRYAIEFLTQDVRHAGFYGEYSVLPAVPSSAPDACAAPTAGAVSDTVNSALALPVQGYQASSFTAAPSVPTACQTLLSSLNLMPGSDVLVVRRTDSSALGVTSTTSATPEANAVYLQTTPTAAQIQLGAASAINSTQNAAGAATSLYRRDLSAATSGVPPAYPQITANMRKYRTHVYFVAPCSVPTGGGSVCTGATDDNGTPIPTLKRLELGTSGAFSIVPIAEGIQMLRVEYGVDNSPTGVDPGTKLPGDGIPDTFTHSPAVADMGNTVAVRLYVLARNTSSSPGYTDDKTYLMGSNAAADSFTPTSALNYKRHVYSAETQVSNASGRREIPR